MAKQKPAAPDIADILRQTAAEERRLLKRERRAEKQVVSLREEVAAAEAKVLEAQERLARRCSALAEAERELDEHRTARIRGPQLSGLFNAAVVEPASNRDATAL